MRIQTLRSWPWTWQPKYIAWWSIHCTSTFLFFTQASKTGFLLTVMILSTNLYSRPGWGHFPWTRWSGCWFQHQPLAAAVQFPHVPHWQPPSEGYGHSRCALPLKHHGWSAPSQHLCGQRKQQSATGCYLHKNCNTVSNQNTHQTMITLTTKQSHCQSCLHSNTNKSMH